MIELVQSQFYFLNINKAHSRDLQKEAEFLKKNSMINPICLANKTHWESKN